ncbi:MAG TPA: 2'-deoxycytidine 5'-triphosphate deaminase, partial [Mycobacteriales bacterium]|nr:2'-deoxycytidine 5'-triphosphate deaminase [Mycobacteriales bacterium]
LVGDDLGQVGYRAKKNSHLLDLSLLDHYDPDEFWEPVKREKGNRVVLEPEEFYLLLSHEGVRVPPGYAAEMTAYDPTSGELRTHYAGFFDPGFGHGMEPLVGSRAALEVRAHDVPFMIEHRQPVCKLSYERMLEVPSSLYGEGLRSHYQFQRGTLSKHFRRP